MSKPMNGAKRLPAAKTDERHRAEANPTELIEFRTRATGRRAPNLGRDSGNHGDHNHRLQRGDP
jgi:hypothetical protein